MAPVNCCSSAEITREPLTKVEGRVAEADNENSGNLLGREETVVLVVVEWLVEGSACASREVSGAVQRDGPQQGLTWHPTENLDACDGSLLHAKHHREGDGNDDADLRA